MYLRVELTSGQFCCGALEERSRQTFDIVAIIPEHAVNTIYSDKAY